MDLSGTVRSGTLRSGPLSKCLVVHDFSWSVLPRCSPERLVIVAEVQCKVTNGFQAARRVKRVVDCTGAARLE